MSISMYNLDEENKNKFCGGIIVSSHDLVANVMYEAIRCKSFPELPRHAYKLLDDVKETFEKDCKSIGDDFKYRKFKDVNEIKDWLYKNIFPLTELIIYAGHEKENVTDLISEIADVYIMIDQYEIIIGITALTPAAEVENGYNVI